MKTNSNTLLNDPDQFIGTTTPYRFNPTSKMFLTDGIKYLCDKYGCYWLMDLVSSVKHKKKIKENRDFILWNIKVNEDDSGLVKALTDSPGYGKLLYQQEIPYTDLKLKEFEFYQQGDLLMLKEED